MSAPARIQRRRTKGWRKPAGSVYVGRGTRWGNPNRIVRDRHGLVVTNDLSNSTIGTWPNEQEARRFAAEAYLHWLRQPEQAALLAAARTELAGRDLMCWCPLPAEGEPDHCHAAVLIRLANSPAAVTR